MFSQQWRAQHKSNESFIYCLSIKQLCTWLCISRDFYRKSLKVGVGYFHHFGFQYAFAYVFLSKTPDCKTYYIDQIHNGILFRHVPKRKCQKVNFNDFLTNRIIHLTYLHMNWQWASLCERLVTYFTWKWFLPCVDP